MGLVGLVTPLHHRAQRACGERYTFVHRQRREGERGRTFHVARHQKAPGWQRRQRILLVAAGAQIGGENLRRLAGLLLVRGRIGVQRRRESPPVFSQHGARSARAGFQRFARPLGVALGEQRQIEQPFARIVHDVDGQRRDALAPAARALEFQRDAQFGNPPRRLWPVAILARHERRQMFLIGETWHGVVWLRIEHHAPQTPFGMDAKHRHVAPALVSPERPKTHEIVHQRGDEHRLARARQARHAKPQPLAGHVIRNALRRDAGFKGKVGEKAQCKGSGSAASM